MLAPSVGDAEITAAILGDFGAVAFACPDLDALCEALEVGAGAAIVTEEAVLLDRSGRFRSLIASQPDWSDLPLVVLLRAGPTPPAALAALQEFGSPTLVRRPVQIHNLVTTVQSALRDRRRQYAVRDHFAELTRMHEALRETNEALRAVYTASPLGVVIVDLDGIVTLWNPAAESLFGWSADEVVVHALPTIPPGLVDEFRGNLARAFAGWELTPYESRRLRKDGSVVEVAMWPAPLRDGGGTVTAVMSLFADISERRRLEESRARLEARLARAEEEERHRISRELHDQLGQLFASLIIGMDALGRDLPDGTPAARSLAGLRQLARQLDDDVHRIARELRPTSLDDLGLHTTLLNLCEEWGERAKVVVDYFGGEMEKRRLPPAVETAIYRIAQEALTNVLKHASAGRVTLVLRCLDGELRLVVEDDGVGFDAESPASEGRLGLLSMRERAALIGADLEIESAPGKGTAVIVRMPHPQCREGGNR